MKGIVLLICAAIVLSLAAAPIAAQTIQNVELHAYMLNRLYANPDYNTTFATERVSLSAVAKLGTDGTGYVEVYFHPWMPSVGPAEQFRTYLESAYVDLPFVNGRIRIGKGRQLNFGLTPTYPNRKTTQYGIISETFTQDRIQGFQYAYKKDKFDFGVSLYEDLRAGNRRVGDFPDAISARTVPHIVDKDIPGDLSGRMAVSARAGVTMPSFQAHLSAATGKLNPADSDTIATAYDTTTGDRDHNKYGIDAVYSWGPFVAQAEYYEGNFSFLKVSGYNLLFGYQPKDKTRFYVRYGALDNHRTPLADSPLTWDNRQLTVGIVQPIRPGIWAELNYEKNDETPGDLDNDLLFVEFFTGF